MSKISLVAQVCMYNEVEKGNLDRCLDNLLQYCDHIVIYDDASTDNSVAVAEKYGAHVIRGKVNNQMQELAHKQVVLEKSLELGATHLFWLDCDEVLDRAGTMGGLRQLCENWPDRIDAFSFPEINLWRSQTWQRLDSLFIKARFVRLWKAVTGISFNIREGVHKQLYPATIKNIQEAPFGVIHYGFHDYKKMMVKIGAHQMSRAALQRCAEFGIDGQGANWILDERKCACRKLPDDVYPPGCLPPDIWQRPCPRPIETLEPYVEIPNVSTLPLIDKRALEEWDKMHQAGYHGLYDNTLERNLAVKNNAPLDPWNRASLFKFNPAGKTIVDLACGGGWFMLDCLINGAQKVIGVEINDMLIEQAQRSFWELAIPKTSYEFLNIADLSQDFTQVDMVYCMAMFMHIPFWQSVRFFQWVYSILKPGGEAHLQFYQSDGAWTTKFWCGTTEGKNDSVSTIRLDHELERAGLTIKEKRLAQGVGVLPVWQLYRCVKEAS
jgi:SAM-dependent methyltransferase